MTHHYELCLTIEISNITDKKYICHPVLLSNENILQAIGELEPFAIVMDLAKRLKQNKKILNQRHNWLKEELIHWYDYIYKDNAFYLPENGLLLLVQATSI